MPPPRSPAAPRGVLPLPQDPPKSASSAGCRRRFSGGSKEGRSHPQGAAGGPGGSCPPGKRRKRARSATTL
eukprot:3770935-Alexandrium_andersonii.AAC.1